ncbi:MAG: hypothetical protein U9P80_00910 [Thermodesulfobacteriota bacterium]|nr:hypothetical protein [Thermodesulfobacteriota bacterium]
MNKTIIFAMSIVFIFTSQAYCGQGDVDKEESDKGPGAVHIVLAYIPNRILDALDTVRIRARIGPGFAVGVRATEAADLFAGTYTTVYAGLPGPRGRTIPRSPIGIESRTGIEASVVDVSTGLGFAPKYGKTEVGLGFQTFIAGLDIGVDPLEIVDFGLGIFCIDIKHDDL